MALAEFFFLVVLVLILLTHWYKRNFNFWNKRNIPNVRGIFSGNLIDIITNKTSLGHRLKSIFLDAKFQNASVVGIYVPHRPALLIRDPDLLKLIFNKDFNNFRDRFARSDPHVDPLGSKVLTIAPYVFWKEMRTKISPIFSGGKIKRMHGLIEKSGENLEAYLLKQGTGSIVEIKHLTKLYTIDIINTTILGIDSNVLQNPQDQLAIEILRDLQFKWQRHFHWLLIFLMPQLTRVFKAKVFSKEFEEFLKKSTTLLVTERERSGLKRNDLIDVFVQLKRETQENGEDLNMFMDNIAAQVGTFLFAGFDTSSTTLLNILFQLAKHREIQEKLRKEILQAFSEGKGEITYEAINELKYLEMILSETLRMYPITGLLERKHNTSDDGSSYSLKPYLDYSLEPGMPVYISIYALHYNPQYWPNPEIFNPERFTPENIKSRHPMVYLPFGSGPRNCIGARLGILQIKNALVYFMKNHYIQICDQTNLNPEWDNNALVPNIKGDIHLQIIKDNMYNNEFLK